MLEQNNSLPPFPFYFIRHGETDWNSRSIIMGSKDIPLNELGVKQAHEASHLLENELFEVIISSPRMRAKQTAELIAKKTHKPILFEERLVEINWGEAEGMPVDPTKSIFDDAHRPKGAELFSAFQQRVVDAISAVLLRKKLPLIVSHGGVFKALTHHMGYKDLSSSNCMPFFFTPPIGSTKAWGVCHLSKNDETGLH
ncbi:MAG: histidine phosphatase family protein [Alphaproteobacteria bacterium]|nr:histidine phosphatase family protein [Alphaproteobacteria bacterium]